MSRFGAPDKARGNAWGAIVWRKQSLPGGGHRYIVRVGDRSVGEVWPPTVGIDGWCAISYAQGGELLGLRGVRGFRSRWKATEYLLDVGVRPPRED